MKELDAEPAEDSQNSLMGVTYCGGNRSWFCSSPRPLQFVFASFLIFFSIIKASVWQKKKNHQKNKLFIIRSYFLTNLSIVSTAGMGLVLHYLKLGFLSKCIFSTTAESVERNSHFQRQCSFFRVMEGNQIPGHRISSGARPA